MKLFVGHCSTPCQHGLGFHVVRDVSCVRTHTLKDGGREVLDCVSWRFVALAKGYIAVVLIYRNDSSMQMKLWELSHTHYSTCKMRHR